MRTNKRFISHPLSQPLFMSLKKEMFKCDKNVFSTVFHVSAYKARALSVSTVALSPSPGGKGKMITK